LAKTQSPGIRPGTANAQIAQARREARIDWQWTERTFRFRLAHLALHDGSLDEHRHFVPVETTPPEPDDPKAKVAMTLEGS